MSTPMYDLPEHCQIGLTVDNRGPADGTPEFYRWGCWCDDVLCNQWVTPRSIWVNRENGRRIQVVHTQFKGEVYYRLLPPYNSVRDYGAMFISQLGKEYDKEE